jgi:hypothetical protein
MEEKLKLENISRIRKRALERLEDLKKKLETNEPCPEKAQDYDLLADIDDHIETCLNNWYY